MLASQYAEQIDAARELAAIAQVETGGNAAAVGRAGETLAVQMTPAMYRHYHGDAAAALRDIEASLPRIGMPVSPYTVALAWNCGLTKLSRRQISDSAADYARRVKAIYDL